MGQISASTVSLRIIIVVFLFQIYIFHLAGVFNLQEIIRPEKQVEDSLSEKSLPNFLLLSPVKCGALAVDHFLSYHPHLISAHNKNIRYFDNVYDHGKEWYLNQLYNHFSTKKQSSQRTNQYEGQRQSNAHKNDDYYLFYETSETYFNNIETIRRVVETYSTSSSPSQSPENSSPDLDLKIAVITCDPTSRAYKLYKSRKYSSNSDFTKFIDQNLPKIIESFESDGKSPYEFTSKTAMFENFRKSLDESISSPWATFLDGFVNPYFSWWEKALGPEKVRIFNFDEFVYEPWFVLNEIERFLGLEEFFHESLFQNKVIDGQDYYFLEAGSDVAKIWGNLSQVHGMNEEERSRLDEFYLKFKLK